MHPLIQGADLARPPIRMQPLEPHHFADHLRTQLLRMLMRSARFLGQTFQTPAQQSRSPFVAGLGADAVFDTQRPKIVRAQCFQRKLNSVIHRLTRFPSHSEAYRSSPPVLSVTYVLNHHRHPCSEPALVSDLRVIAQLVVSTGLWGGQINVLEHSAARGVGPPNLRPTGQVIFDFTISTNETVKNSRKHYCQRHIRSTYSAEPSRSQPSSCA